MNKAEALKKAIERRKEQTDEDFQQKVEDLVWAIEEASQKLRDLKEELTKLTYQEPTIPDVADCIQPD